MPFLPHVVWICQWYPHEGEPYAGDFIQRHAQAAALYLPIHTYACFPHTTNKVQVYHSPNLTEHLIYYKPVRTGISFLDKTLNWWQWYRLLKSHLKHHIAEEGRPDFLHCHITLNTGWLGLWAKKKYGIPYGVSEHWSGYMPGAKKGFNAYNPVSKKLFAKIIRQSSFVTTVSKALMNEMQIIENHTNYVRIPNVVNEVTFHIEREGKITSEYYDVLHISTFSPQKNLPDTVAAILSLVQKDRKFRFHLVGPATLFRQEYPKAANHPQIILHNEMPQAQLATLMQQCQVCVLYSHYETFGCVIIEANAVGLPVIVSDISVFREIVQHRKNGLLVPPGNPEALEMAIQSFFETKSSFDKAVISADTINQFSYKRVGKQFLELYKSVVQE